MHNIHFVRTNAPNPEEACNTVECEIMDWGNENNWRTICGAVDKKGKVHDLTAGRWTPSLPFAKKMMQDEFTTPDCFHLEAVNKLISKGIDSLNTSEWYCVKKYAEWHSAKSVGGAKKRFNVWKHSFRDWELDECGLTDLDHLEEGNPYLVFVDMHS